LVEIRFTAAGAENAEDSQREEEKMRRGKSSLFSLPLRETSAFSAPAAVEARPIRAVTFCAAPVYEITRGAVDKRHLSRNKKMSLDKAS
jgi:hypothetical protein